MIWIVHLNHGDCAAITGDVDATQARVIFHAVTAAGNGQVLNNFVLIEVKYGEEIVFFANEKCPVPPRVERHSVVSAAAPHGVLRDDAVRQVLRIPQVKALSEEPHIGEDNHATEHVEAVQTGDEKVGAE